MLGEGSFGKVLEVVKRDCGQKYAMKIQEKRGLETSFGDNPLRHTFNPASEAAVPAKEVGRWRARRYPDAAEAKEEKMSAEKEAAVSHCYCLGRPLSA